jgi:hypothetical protein
MADDELVREDETGAGEQDLEGDEALQGHEPRWCRHGRKSPWRYKYAFSSAA